MEDRYFMKMALALAEKGRGFTSPNPMVGSVVVKDGRVVGRGWHEKAGKPHAEVNAIDDAGIHAAGATMYVTLEPCNHFGKTPPCTQKIIHAGIARTVVAMPDPNPDVTGGGMDCLKQAGIEVSQGVCEKQAMKLNESFIKFIQTKHPFVILKTASTLDGQIATRTGDAKWVTGEPARLFVHRIRHEVDAIMVGIGTVLADNPSLTTRLPDRKGKDPIRIVLDTKLSIPENARLLKPDSEAETIIVCGKSAPDDRKTALMKKGIRIIQTDVTTKGINLPSLMPILGQMGITSLLIEGGGKVIHSALAAGIIDKVLLFYAPKILGGNDGIPMCSGKGPEKMSQAIHLSDMSVQRFENDIMIEGYLGK
ncbi:MAG: bifunctional diaminohydroxyphosphoribosylaminopyrimidine deaminase/5-amino-6-(5-phosphoribosylamino)uracil reductase RibD [Pseudomonadota bacterium]